MFDDTTANRTSRTEPIMDGEQHEFTPDLVPGIVKLLNELPGPMTQVRHRLGGCTADNWVLSSLMATELENEIVATGTAHVKPGDRGKNVFDETHMPGDGATYEVVGYEGFPVAVIICGSSGSETAYYALPPI